MKRFLTIALVLVCAMLTFMALAENVPPAQTTSIPAQTAEPLTGSAAPVSGTPAPGTDPAADASSSRSWTETIGEWLDWLGAFVQKAPYTLLLAGALLGVGIARLCRRGPETEAAVTETEPREEPTPEPPANPAVWQVGNVHHIGRRSYQQDAFGVSALGDEPLVRESGVLAVLADGMGGMNNSGEMSQAVVRAVLNAFGRVRGEQSETLTQLMRLAFDTAQNQFAGAGAGSTLILASVRDGILDFASIGDSHIALWRGGALITLNREHCLGAQLRRQAALGLKAWQQVVSDPKRAALTAYLGRDGDPEADFPAEPIRLLPGDKIVLMSDGVYGTLDEKMLSCLLENEAALAADAIEKMVLTCAKPNQDNFTALILEIR
ncbi:MAG: protein phosphatase 2C domain-containing protein [Clostridia bacterium]|nr:protein phosphatase 2C domain-containing protein [Clostridia bacterium]